MNKFFTTLTLFVALASSLKSQTQKDTLFNYITKTPVTIDGQATEECWSNAEWHNMHQVLIPYGATMKEGDFSGKFKVAWDEQYLYLLVEVIDDSISDDHAIPTENYWDDDCVEVFIDENRSGGDQERNNNAFSYHVSTFYDAIDISSTGAGINYKENIEVIMDTIGENTYLWELAIKNYSAAFNPNNPEASRVLLTPNKLMGFALAYCDNDETTSRENFIGSMTLTSATSNDLYKNASLFGPMLLIDPDYVDPTNINDHKIEKINIYPNPTKSQFTITKSGNNNNLVTYSLTTLTGQLLKTHSFIENSHTLNIDELCAGVYLLNVELNKTKYAELIIKE